MLAARDKTAQQAGCPPCGCQARAVIQWLQIVQDRRTDGEERKCPEKQFLLVDSQSVKTNPREFNDIEEKLDWS